MQWPYQPFHDWPEKYRAAICFTWDVDDEAPFYSRTRRPLDVSEVEQRHYGMRRALPMVIDLLQDHNIPGAFYVPAYIARRWSSIIADLDRAGFEIGAHGYLHEAVGGMSREEEVAIVDASHHVLADICGHSIDGYRTPSWQCNPWTIDLLHQAGFLYDSSLMGDIAPYRVETASGASLLEVPIHWYWDDVEYWGHTQATRDHAISPPSAVLEIWKAEMDAVVEAGGCFVLTLHPHVSGRPGLLTAVAELMSYARTLDNVWLTTPGNIAHHVVHSQSPVPQVAAPAGAADRRWSRGGGQPDGL